MWEYESLPAVYDDGFVSGLLLDPEDLSDEVDHPSPLFRGTILWPGNKLEVVHNSRRSRALHTHTHTMGRAVGEFVSSALYKSHFAYSLNRHIRLRSCL